MLNVSSPQTFVMLVLGHHRRGTCIQFLISSSAALTPRFDVNSQTIVSTSLPTITHSLSGPNTLYSWVGTSYLVAQVRSNVFSIIDKRSHFEFDRTIQTIIQPILAKLCQFAGFKVCQIIAVTTSPIDAVAPWEDDALSLRRHFHGRVGRLRGRGHTLFPYSVSRFPGKALIFF